MGLPRKNLYQLKEEGINCYSNKPFKLRLILSIHSKKMLI